MNRTFSQSMQTGLLGLLAFVAAQSWAEARLRDLDLRIDVTYQGKPIQLGALRYRTSTDEKTQFSMTRLDYLISNVSFQRPDGTWLSTSNWFAFFSLEQNRHQARIYGIPSKSYQAIRFSVGLPRDINHGDPNQYGQAHPLNPNLNRLHWGWMGGYIFMALEGIYQTEAGKLSGFSYHVANNENRMWVEVPVSLDASRHSTLVLNLEVARIIDFNLVEKPDSTHSREGDDFAPELARKIEKAFSFKEATLEKYQSMEKKAPQVADPSPHQDMEFVSSPLPLFISERLPQVEVPQDNIPTVAGAELGRALFFDKRLSYNESQSCATCHHAKAAFTDPGKTVSVGASGKLGRRNSMPLFNLLWHSSFFWDGRSPSLRDQVLHPIESDIEMNAKLEDVIAVLKKDQGMGEQFEAAFGSPEVTSERLALALEQYLFSLISQDSKFDRAVRGEVKFTEQESRGLELFLTEHDPANNLRGADCFHCHGGNLFTNHGFHNNGLEIKASDLGRFEVTGEESDKGKFKTPSLRNIAVTAPYMHDGRFQTLEEVVEHYDTGIHRTPSLDPNIAKHPSEGLKLSPEDKQALVAFLKTLTDHAFLDSETDP